MMASMSRVRRSRGAGSGVLLVLLGLFGGLIPFIGPYFHFAYTPDRPWVATAGRVWLEVLPGVAALIGGLIMMTSRSRVQIVAGALLAALGGIWFGVGTMVSAQWPQLPAAGSPAGTASGRILAEQLAFHTGVALVIVFVAAVGIGRVSAVAGRGGDGWDEFGDPVPGGRSGYYEPEPAELEPATRTTRTIARVVPVPVARGRSRQAEAGG